MSLPNRQRHGWLGPSVSMGISQRICWIKRMIYQYKKFYLPLYQIDKVCGYGYGRYLEDLADPPMIFLGKINVYLPHHLLEKVLAGCGWVGIWVSSWGSNESSQSGFYKNLTEWGYEDHHVSMKKIPTTLPERQSSDRLQVGVEMGDFILLLPENIWKIRWIKLKNRCITPFYGWVISNKFFISKFDAHSSLFFVLCSLFFKMKCV